MPTLKEKVFSRITEDFQVLAKIVIRQLNLTKQLMDDNHKEEIYTEINNNERIILADEISPDTCRFWDSTTHEKLDKDRFRRDMGGVEDAYQEIMHRIFGENK